MASFIAMLTGILYSIMNTLNAELSVAYGMLLSTAIVHLAGALCLWPLLLTSWGKRKRPARWFLYLGGPLGIVTVVAYNIGITSLGVTASMAISLLGQIGVSALMDQRGLFGAKPIRINPFKLTGMGIIAAGCVLMIVFFVQKEAENVPLAVFMLLLTGFSIVLARIVNAMLAAVSGVGHSTIMNHTTGLFGCLLLLAITGFQGFPALSATGLPWYCYLGGPLGAVSVFILNLITKKIPHMHMTLLLFVGQAVSALIIDGLYLDKFSPMALPGIALVALGMAVNSRGDGKSAKEQG